MRIWAHSGSFGARRKVCANGLICAGMIVSLNCGFVPKCDGYAPKCCHQEVGMPAKCSKPMQRRIRELYAAGEKKMAIASELGLSRDTVAKYCVGVDAEVELIDTPAATLSRGEVGRLKALAAGVELTRCDDDKGCGTEFAVLKVGLRERKVPIAWYCPSCGTQWLVASSAWGSR